MDSCAHDPSLPFNCPPGFKNEITNACIGSDPAKTPISIGRTNGVRLAHVNRNGPNATAYPIGREITGDRVER